MPEGLSAQEVGKEIAEHAESKGKDHAQERRDRLVSIAEAVLLSIVALMAAWSGYAAAKWSTESRVGLAEASTARTKASRANLQAIDLRNFDSSTFEAWFTAYTAHNKQAMALAEHRFRPGFRVAFDAWRATKPESNPNAPRGPTYMPQYRQPDWEVDGARQAGRRGLRRRRERGRDLRQVHTCHRLPRERALPCRHQHAIPAARRVRYALVGLGAVLLVFSLVQLTQLPGPPT